MGKPFTQIYLHLVWATWDRLPLIKPDFESALYAILVAECTDLKVDVRAVGGMDDHVHLLVRTPPTLSASQIVKQIKGSSSHFVNNECKPDEGFKWQGYYGAFSVSSSQVPRVEEYILRQKERHALGKLWKNAERIEWPDLGSE
jgi:putative transposase